MTTFWFLLAILGTDRVQAFGPYPSLELCKSAGHYLIQSEPSFWSDEIKRDVREHKRMFFSDVSPKYKLIVPCVTIKS